MDTGRSVIECLTTLLAWPRAVTYECVASAFGYPLLDLPALQALTPLFDTVSYRECDRRGVMVAQSADGSCQLVLCDPFDAKLEDWALTRCRAARLPAVQLALADAVDLRIVLARHESQLRAIGDTPAHTHEELVTDSAIAITFTSIEEDDRPVVKLVNSTIYDALKLGASDIHLECDAAGLAVRYRIDGVLQSITQVRGHELAEQVISRVKVMADLDISERRVPQDGRFKARVHQRDIDFRVSVMPTIFGEDAVLRLLDRQSLTEQTTGLRLEHLGMDQPLVATIRHLASRPHGMLLVTGPTGSGKTTTLYAAIHEIHDGRDKIVTIEDPVEYRLAGVVQIPVNERKGLTFARGLRSILRHDPDKIMVGEIRDDETAHIAVQAALTGHLVFTTVHANSVFDVLGRFLHMGVDPYSFAAALNGILAQRLVRMNCPHCSVDTTPDENLVLESGLTLGAVRDWRFRCGTGCVLCRGTGYKGRRAAAEVLLLNDALRELIASRSSVSMLKQEAQRAGLRPLRESALSWVATGETTLTEVCRVVG